MAEPLKSYFGPDVPARIASMIEHVDGAFAVEAFVADALEGYEALELTPRAWQIARALGRHLPQDYERAIEILIASLGPKLEVANSPAWRCSCTCRACSSSPNSAPTSFRRPCGRSTS
jgi:hypothetical protein